MSPRRLFGWRREAREVEPPSRDRTTQGPDWPCVAPPNRRSLASCRMRCPLRWPPPVAVLARLAAGRVAHAAGRDRLVARTNQLETTAAKLASANAKAATLGNAKARLEAILAGIRRAHSGA